MSTNPLAMRESSRGSSFLFLYDNMNIVMVFDSFLKGEQSNPSFTPPKMSLTQNRPKAVEMLKKAKYNFMIVDQACIGAEDPRQWIIDFRKELQGGASSSTEMKVFLLSPPSITNDDIEGFLKAGFDDIFFKPIDMPIVAQKINNITDVIFSQQDQLYLAPITTAVKIAYRYELDGLSEAGCRLLTEQPMPVGDVFSMIVPEFEKFGVRELVAKVLDCKDHPTRRGKFSLKINFIGLQPSVTKSIRRWMVEEYVKTK